MSVNVRDYSVKCGISGPAALGACYYLNKKQSKQGQFYFTIRGMNVLIPKAATMMRYTCQCMNVTFASICV